MNIARRTRCLVVTAGIVMLGCSDEQRRDLGEVDVRESLAGQVEAAVDEQGLALESDLDCSSEIAEDGTVTGSCSGSTKDGAAVTGTFAGTGDAEAGSCAAHLVVEVDADTVVDEPAADCFDVG